MFPPYFLLPYDRERAVEYARRWALDRNPEFDNFAGIGGDCTNFVSQAILAGCVPMDMTPTLGWYFVDSDDRAPAWTGVEAFFDYITGSGDFLPVTDRVGPVGAAADRDYVEPGDVVQLADESGDFYHTLMITDIDDDGEIYVSAHTLDALDRPLSSYTNASERFIKLLGALNNSAEPPCNK